MEQWLRNVEEGYDRVAQEYTARIFGELAHKPFDRALLDRFAEIVRPRGPTCDVGCGPAHVARYLHERGVSALGLDISAGMLAQARRLNPGITFVQGSMIALPFADDSLGGITAMYSIIHVPCSVQPETFEGMQRALRPGGALLLGFHAGEQIVHLDEWWGRSVSIDFLFFTRDEVERRLKQAGFSIEESAERPPYPDVEQQTQRAYILARTPAGT